jgi:hypothetical protein
MALIERPMHQPLESQKNPFTSMIYNVFKDIKPVLSDAHRQGDCANRHAAGIRPPSDRSDTKRRWPEAFCNAQIQGKKAAFPQASPRRRAGIAAAPQTGAKKSQRTILPPNLHARSASAPTRGRGCEPHRPHSSAVSDRSRGCNEARQPPSIQSFDDAGIRRRRDTMQHCVAALGRGDRWALLPRAIRSGKLCADRSPMLVHCGDRPEAYAIPLGHPG